MTLHRDVVFDEGSFFIENTPSQYCPTSPLVHPSPQEFRIQYQAPAQVLPAAQETEETISDTDHAARHLSLRLPAFVDSADSVTQPVWQYSFLSVTMEKLTMSKEKLFKRQHLGPSKLAYNTFLEAKQQNNLTQHNLPSTPRTQHEAKKHRMANEWKTAMDEHLQRLSLTSCNTAVSSRNGKKNREHHHQEAALPTPGGRVNRIPLFDRL